MTLFDYGILVANFGLTEEDPNFNPEADLDGDTEVTLFDFGILVNNFGQIGVDALTGVEQPMEEGLAVPVRLQLGDWGGHPNRTIQVEFRAKAVGTESNPTAPVYVKTVGIVAPSAEVEVELTLPAGAYTVQAKASHWLRGEVMGVGTQPLLKVYPGNQRVLLWWEERGTTFRVYKGTSPTQMQQIASVSNGYFIDTQVSNDTTYCYQVERVVNLQRSVLQNVSPAAYVWLVAPNPSQTVTVTADYLLTELANAVGVVPNCQVLLDDKDVVAAVAPTPPAPVFTTTPVWLETLAWKQGLHYLIIRDSESSNALDFLVLDFQPQFVSELVCDKDAITPGESVVLRLRHDGNGPWTLTISYPDGQGNTAVVRQWTGTGSGIIQALWDGTDALGNPVDDGTYFVDFQSGSIIRAIAHVYYGPYPRRPAMLAVIASDWREKDWTDETYARFIEDKFRLLRWRGLMWPHRVVHMKKVGSARTSLVMGEALQHAPLRLLYIYGHAVFQSFCQSRERIPAFELMLQPRYTWAAYLPGCYPQNVSSVESYFRSNPMKWALRFVWIDTCWSFGSTDDADDGNRPAEFSSAWASRAFPLNDDPDPNEFGRVVMGWQGPAYLNHYGDNPLTPERDDGWYEWRRRFWNNLAAGGMFWQAIDSANRMPQIFYQGWDIRTPNRRIRYDGNLYQTLETW